MFSYAHFPNRQSLPLSLTPTIQNQVWDVTRGERAEYIEAIISQPGHSATRADHGASCWYGALVDHEILEWVTRYGDSKRPTSHQTSIAPIRLLILERERFQPPSFPIRMETYFAIEKHFGLSEDTLLALSSVQGMSTYNIDIDEETGRLRRLSMVIKAHQKFQVGNYGLAFSYDFETNMSTGILHGTGVTQYGDEYELWSKHAAAEIFEHVKTVRHFWDHPLCLPVALLQHHLLRTDYFCQVILTNRHTAVQYELGAVRAGRLHGLRGRDIAAELPVHQAKISLAELTVTMSSLTFDAIWFCSVSDWQCSCLKLLLDVLTDIEDVGLVLKEARSMHSKIRYLTSLAESIKRCTNGMKENGQADMSVLHSIISQVDNRLNAKLAAAASHDSAAMKTLAFLTTLFLPGTFVATIFSTDFFNWSDNGTVVSDLFWVYWAWAVPLTIVVAAGWRVWWSFEKKRFDEDVKAEINASSGEVANGRPKPP